ncbi:PPE family protein [Mycobacterium marinum]|uniref:PPE family protein n=1 Tax=Mycobacterium marinum TaxID=1781 RepID=UPI0003589218|nr:PPE family protein [Mycobacterium marinum]EPQ78199.1 PPE family protein [Mycobacterium marinum MB2]MDC8981618.1 PPE family protein [Mycobacterium marinum]MDC8998639.1 PPE family protein [Mycobacterium marinum]MDC9009035.1 PPE family protein [Mycobacterium marinum]MDC9015220.1 PPE family protein [Mycobacterium marinum]
MIDFGALPPEINSARIYTGPGPGSLSAAAASWASLAAELQTAAGYYQSVVSGLTSGGWLGPASLSMASAFWPYVTWTSMVATQAGEAASQATLAVGAYETALAMTVPPPVVAANRVQLATLTATNFFGQNSPAIAATEAAYSEMWAQDALAMYDYAANSASACALTVLNSPPEVVNPAGAATQTTAVTQATAASGAQAAAVTGTDQLSLAGLVSAVPTMLGGLASPTSALTAATSSLLPELGTTPIYALPSYFMAAGTPLYAMSSILGMAQTAQGLANGAAAAVQGAAAGAASSGASALGSLGSGVVGGLGNAASLGPLSVPASWTSVIPTLNGGAISGLPNAGLDAANAAPTVLGAAPRGALAGAPRSPGPRYGVVPTIMSRPPSGGYA